MPCKSLAALFSDIGGETYQESLITTPWRVFTNHFPFSYFKNHYTEHPILFFTVKHLSIEKSMISTYI